MLLAVRVPSHATSFAAGPPEHGNLKVVEKCGVTYSMLSTPEAASDVFFDPQDGVLAGLSAGKSLVDCATLQVEVGTHMYTSPFSLCVIGCSVCPDAFKTSGNQ